MRFKPQRDQLFEGHPIWVWVRLFSLYKQKNEAGAAMHSWILRPEILSHCWRWDEDKKGNGKESQRKSHIYSLLLAKHFIAFFISYLGNGCNCLRTTSANGEPNVTEQLINALNNRPRRAKWPLFAYINGCARATKWPTPIHLDYATMPISTEKKNARGANIFHFKNRWNLLAEYAWFSLNAKKRTFGNNLVIFVIHSSRTNFAVNATCVKCDGVRKNTKPFTTTICIQQYECRCPTSFWMNVLVEFACTTHAISGVDAATAKDV